MYCCGLTGEPTSDYECIGVDVRFVVLLLVRHK
jgi:hypothetical protein